MVLWRVVYGGVRMEARRLIWRLRQKMRVTLTRVVAVGNGRLKEIDQAVYSVSVSFFFQMEIIIVFRGYLGELNVL